MKKNGMRGFVSAMVPDVAKSPRREHGRKAVRMKASQGGRGVQLFADGVLTARLTLLIG